MTRIDLPLSRRESLKVAAAARPLGHEEDPQRWFYHDERFATLEDVVNHSDNHLGLKLTAREKRELIEYLGSI